MYDVNSSRFKCKLTKRKIISCFSIIHFGSVVSATWVVFSTCVEKWKMLSVANRFVIQTFRSQSVLFSLSLFVALFFFLSFCVFLCLMPHVQHKAVSTLSFWIAVKFCGCASGKRYIVAAIFNRIALFTFFPPTLFMISIVWFAHQSQMLCTQCGVNLDSITSLSFEIFSIFSFEYQPFFCTPEYWQKIP